jgi:hypothetical protein
MATIKLTPQDLAEALRSERTIQAAADAAHIAQHQHELASAAHERLIAQLRIIYQAPADRYTLTDWLEGFTEKQPNG